MPFEEISPQVYSGWSGPAPVWSLPTFIPQREYKPSVGTAEEPSWRDKNVFNETPRYVHVVHQVSFLNHVISLSLQRSHSPRFRVRPQQPYNGPNSGGTGNRRWVRRVDSRYVDLKQRNPTHERGRSVNPFDSAQVTPESLAERIMLCLSPPQSASFFVDVGASAFISQAYINNIEAPPAKESSVDKSHTYASTRFPNAQRDWRTLYENGNKSATAFANGFNDYTPPSANPNAATLCEDCHQGHETLPDTPSKMTEESGAELVRALMKFYRSHYKCLLCGDQASSDGSEFMDHVRNHMDAPGSVYQRTYDK
jgi:hypothetical protein